MGETYSILETMMLLQKTKLVDGKPQLHNKHLTFHGENQPGLLVLDCLPSRSGQSVGWFLRGFGHLSAGLQAKSAKNQLGHMLGV